MEGRKAAKLEIDGGNFCFNRNQKRRTPGWGNGIVFDGLGLGEEKNVTGHLGEILICAAYSVLSYLESYVWRSFPNQKQNIRENDLQA